ncbi:MAG: hypothetical protein AAFN92_06155 [Bacteroidota bacterium]
MTLPKKFSVLLLACLLTSALSAQTATRTIDESFAGKQEVNLKQSHGPLTVQPSTDGQVRVVTRMSVDADEKSEAEAFLAKMEAEFREVGSSLDVSIGIPQIKSWNQNNRKTRVVFKDGTRIRDVENFKLETTLYLPPTDRLGLSIRFEDIRIDENVELRNLKLGLHNADLRGGNLSGNLDVDMRFGSLELGNVGGAVSGNLHNATFELGNTGAVEIDSRFSKIRCGTITTLDFNGHNDRLKLDEVTGKLDIDDRFGNYIIGKTTTGEINSHNGTFDIESGTSYEIEGRFAKVEFSRLEDLEIRNNHNCNYDLDQVDVVEGDGRFTTLDIESLTKKAELDIYNGKLYVDELAPGFREISVDGSFYEVDLDLAGSAEYHVSAELHFGKVSAPRELTVTEDIDEHGEMRYAAKTAGAGADSAVIRVRGRNGQLRVD